MRGRTLYALLTYMLIDNVKQRNVYERMAKTFVTHLSHLVEYDENGFLVYPQYSKRRYTENERLFISALQKIQQEYHDAMKKAGAEQQLTREQRAGIARQLQLQVNEKVLREVDKYIEEYEVDEHHPEYALNAPLRERVKNKNI